MCTEIYHRITQTTVRNKLVNGSDNICRYRGKKLGEKKKGLPISNMVWFWNKIRTGWFHNWRNKSTFHLWPRDISGVFYLFCHVSSPSLFLRDLLLQIQALAKLIYSFPIHSFHSLDNISPYEPGLCLAVDIKCPYSVIKNGITVSEETILTFKFFQHTSLSKSNLNMYINIIPKQTKILNSWVFYMYDISHINSEQQHNQRPILFISEKKVWILILLCTSYEIFGKSQVSISLFPGV